MSVVYRAAVIGCGKMSRGHSRSYANSPRVELAAAADVFAGARKAFTEEFGVQDTYDDVATMLQTVKPDLVSICTWPPLHADLVKLAFDSGVKAVWCEKPMAVHYEDAAAMVQAAADTKGVLIINHQRRYVTAYRQAREVIDSGSIGQVLQITGICGGDALTDGTHLIDLVRFLNHDNPVKTVFAAIDMSPLGSISPDGMGTVEFNETRKRYGHHIETGTLALLAFENGVRGYLEIGSAARGGYQRLTIDGTDGRIELSGDQPFKDGSRIRVRRFGADVESLPASDLDGAMDSVLADMLSSIESGTEHTMRGESALADTEIIMAIFESARQRKRIDLPVNLQNSPLEEMIESGEVPIN
jgi:predicted dehydrogenase